MADTALLYALSTLAQTCAALAAFVGAVGVFRLQLLRDQRREAEIEFRRRSEGLTNRNPMDITLEQIFAGMEDPALQDHSNLPRARQARRHWEAFVPRLRGSRWALIIFEVWNLAVIGVALIGFNYIPSWAGAPWTFYALWTVAVLTAGITVGCVIVWTQGVEE